MLGLAMDFANSRPTAMAIDLLAPRDGETILDVGCGTGAALAETGSRADCRLTGVEPSSAMLAMARSRVGEKARLVPGVLGELPLAEESFDAGLALNMLYFCDEEGRMLADFRRVLKPEGRLVAYVTHRETMDRWAFTRAGYHRLFDADALRQAFECGGFASGDVVIHEVAVTRSVRGLLACARR